MLYVGLGPGTPVAAEIVEHKIDVLGGTIEGD
jgi:hypothetical protein